MEISKQPVEKYDLHLKDKYRPPSKGGNTRAWHQHRLTIEGVVYSFLHPSSQKWGHKNDIVSFEWKWDDTQKYRNIITETLETWDKNDKKVIRGDREPRNKVWRSAKMRLPGPQTD